MEWLDTGPEREAWLALNSCETADELLQSLLSMEDELTLRSPRLKTEPPRFTPVDEEANESDASERVAATNKRKRHPTPCRRKQTLDELRQTARECEAFLTVLKERQNKSGSRPNQQSSAPVNGGAIVNAQQIVAWKNIASRQYRWRRESEKTNEQLRATLSEQAKIIEGLERLLKRSSSVLELTPPISRSLTDLEGSRYARRVDELMRSASDMFTHVNDIIIAVRLQQTQTDPHGVDLPRILPIDKTRGYDLASTSHSRHVPCSPGTIANALWRYFAQSRGSSSSYFRERIEASSDAIVKTFHVCWDNATVTTNHRVINVTRRMRHPSGVEVVVNLADFDGLEAEATRSGFRTQGWSIVQGVAPSSEWEPVALSSDVIFKTVSRPTPPSVDLVTDGGAPATRDRRHDLRTLVKFTLSRHNEAIQRAIDDVMLFPSLR